MDLDNWIETLKRCECLKEEDVKLLCEKATEILVEESNVQRVDAPVTICTWMSGKFPLCYRFLFKTCLRCDGLVENFEN